MTIRYGAAAFLTALLCFAGMFASPAGAAGSSSTLLAAVDNVSSQSDKFRSMMSNINASQIHVVNVQSVMSPSDEAAYKKALRKNASDIADLRDTLGHTTVTGSDGVLVTLTKLLAKQNITVDQVVAVYVSGDQITLFYQ